MISLDKLLFFLTLLATLGSGLVSGVFFAFSTFIMRALGRLPSADGMAAMQSINITVISPLFLSVFLGTGVISIFLAISSLMRSGSHGTFYLLMGAAFYLIGCLAVTFVFNIPLNNALESSSPLNSVDLWSNYLTNWTMWNHVRMVASLVASVLFTFSLVK